MGNITIISPPPVTESRPDQEVYTQQPLGIGAAWFTPGSYVASRVWGNADVRLVAEGFDGDRHSVTVILRRDQEETLNQIYKAEQELYQMTNSMNFTLHVTTPQDDLELYVKRVLNDRVAWYDSD